MRMTCVIVHVIVILVDVFGSSISFTGNVPRDFNPALHPFIQMTTRTASPIQFYLPNSSVSASGWSIHDMRVAYDCEMGALFVGLNSGDCIMGDVDCDGDPSAASRLHGKGYDNYNVSGTEYIVIELTFLMRRQSADAADVVYLLGIPVSTSFSTAESARIVHPNQYDADCVRGTRWRAPFCFGVVVSSAEMWMAAQYGPSATHPHFEVAVANLNEFTIDTYDRVLVTAYCGSLEDGPVGEDVLYLQYDMASARKRCL